MPASPAIRAQRALAVLSVVLFLAKIFAWYRTQSVAMLTDALESTVNVAAGLIGLYSITLAARPRDANHPYGHGKAEFVSAGIEGALILAAGFMIVVESVRRIRHPAPIQELNTGLLIIGATAILNFIAGVLAQRAGRQYRSATLSAAGSHLKSDTYSTAGIIAGLILVSVTGKLWLDAAVALLFAGFIFYNGYRVIRSALAGIMDEADEDLLQKVVAMLQENRPPQWIDLHNLRVIQYGNVLHLDAHLTLPWYWQVQDADEEIQRLESLTRQHFGSGVELFVHIDGCRYYQCKLCAMPACPVRAEALQQQLLWTSTNVQADSKHGKDSGNKK